MDAPHIVTLPDEATSTSGSSAPPKMSQVKFRLNHTLPATGSTTGNIIVLPPVNTSKRATKSGEGDEEDELAEDDGDDAEGRVGAGPSAPAAPPKPPRKPRQMRNQGVKMNDTKRKRDVNREPMLASPTDPAPLMTTFDLASPDDFVHREVPQAAGNFHLSLHSPEGNGSGSSRGRKKSTSGSRPKKSTSKAPSSSSMAPLDSMPQPHLPLPQGMDPHALSSPAVSPQALAPQLVAPEVSAPEHILEDEPDDASEVLDDDAASSPLLAPSILGIDPDVVVLPTPSLEDVDQHLSVGPPPVYPLPNRPFSVLPPPKIGSGFAPIFPLVRGGPPARRWRTVKREVRGVAGGRWFARSWLGEKESAFANAQAAAPAPFLSTVGTPLAGAAEYQFVSAPPVRRGRGRGRGAALSASAGPSRQGSNGPDTPGSHGVRAPTKMRTTIVAEETGLPSGPAMETTEPQEVL